MRTAPAGRSDRATAPSPSAPTAPDDAVRAARIERLLSIRCVECRKLIPREEYAYGHDCEV